MEADLLNFQPVAVSSRSLLKSYSIRNQLEWVHPRMIKVIGYNYGIDPRISTEDAIDQLSELFKQNYYQSSRRISAFEDELENEDCAPQSNKVQFAEACQMRIYNPSSGSVLEDTTIELDKPVVRRSSIIARILAMFR